MKIATLLRQGIKLEITTNKRRASLIVMHPDDYRRYELETYAETGSIPEFTTFEGIMIYRSTDCPKGTCIIK